VGQNPKLRTRKRGEKGKSNSFSIQKQRKKKEKGGVISTLSRKLAKVMKSKKKTHLCHCVGREGRKAIHSSNPT